MPQDGPRVFRTSLSLPALTADFDSARVRRRYSKEKYVSISVTKTGAALGARIEGVDLTKALDDATFAAVRAAFYEHEVVYFRGTEPTDEDHIRFSARFGELRRIKLDQVHNRHPELFVVSNIQKDGQYIGSYDAGIFWHTDGAYLANPHAISALYAHEVPAQDGH